MDKKPLRELFEGMGTLVRRAHGEHLLSGLAFFPSNTKTNPGSLAHRHPGPCALIMVGIEELANGKLSSPLPSRATQSWTSRKSSHFAEGTFDGPLVASAAQHIRDVLAHTALKLHGRCAATSV